MNLTSENNKPLACSVTRNKALRSCDFFTVSVVVFENRKPGDFHCIICKYPQNDDAIASTNGRQEASLHRHREKETAGRAVAKIQLYVISSRLFVSSSAQKVLCQMPKRAMRELFNMVLL